MFSRSTREAVSDTLLQLFSIARSLRSTGVAIVELKHTCCFLSGDVPWFSKLFLALCQSYFLRRGMTIGQWHWRTVAGVRVAYYQQGMSTMTMFVVRDMGMVALWETNHLGRGGSSCTSHFTTILAPREGFGPG